MELSQDSDPSLYWHEVCQSELVS